jgi:hypothetical protein
MKPIVEISPNTPLLPDAMSVNGKFVIFDTFTDKSFPLSISAQDVKNALGVTDLAEYIFEKIPKVPSDRVIHPNLTYKSDDNSQDLSDFLASDKFQNEAQRISTFRRNSSKEILELALNPFLEFSSELKLIDGYFLNNFAKRIYSEKHSHDESKQMYFMRELLRRFSGNITLLLPQPSKRILDKQSPYSNPQDLIIDVIRWFEHEVNNREALTKQVTLVLHWPKTRPEIAPQIKFPHARLLSFKYSSINHQTRSWWVHIDEGLDPYNDESVRGEPVVAQISKLDGENQLKQLTHLKINSTQWLKGYGLKPESNIIRKTVI